MIAFESTARLLLIAHAVIGAATVGAATHLALWVRGYRRGRFGRHKAARRFALIATILYWASFALGNLVYPTYKVRARLEYLENPTAIDRDNALRQEIRQLSERGIELATGEPPEPQHYQPRQPDRLAKVALWFDVKEHVIALATLLVTALFAIMRSWHPREHGDGIATVVWAMACTVAAASWFAAVVGLWVSSYRPVG